MKHLFSLAFMLAAAALCFGQMPARARIDVDGNSKLVGLTNFSVSKGSIRFATWMKPEQNLRFITGDIDIEKNKWTQVSITFTPLATGDVSLQFKGNYWKKNAEDKNISPVPVYYDDVTATGAVIVNGGFEEMDEEKGEPKGWYKGGSEASWFGVPPVVNTDAAFVKSGKQSIRAWHNAVFSHYIKVTANTPVTVSAWVYMNDKE
ncbi:MAG: hypothetical protein HZC28_09935 [Spirochaetes bacterium]|nr:hypothetical protein [Spirochaetota bacterium]